MFPAHQFGEVSATAPPETAAEAPPALRARLLEAPLQRHLAQPHRLRRPHLHRRPQRPHLPRQRVAQLSMANVVAKDGAYMFELL